MPILCKRKEQETYISIWMRLFLTFKKMAVDAQKSAHDISEDTIVAATTKAEDRALLAAVYRLTSVLHHLHEMWLGS